MGKKNKAKGTTVGYSYYMGVQMGLCRAADEIVEVRVGGKKVSGLRPYSASVTSDAIRQPEIFGGKSGEGGIMGTLEWYFGNATQTASSKLRKMLTGDPNGRVPGFRGFVSCYFDGLYAEMNPYPKRWGFRVRRLEQGWSSGTPWDLAKLRIYLGDISQGVQQPQAIQAMNPAHIIVYLLTEPSTGRGLPMAALDLGSFRAASRQLYDEGLGLCLTWTRSQSVENFVQLILDHIAGALYQDRTTGLIKLKLIRDDYDLDLLPVYTTTSGIKSIDDAELAAQDATANEIIVNYRDPVNNVEGSVRAQNLGNLQSDGGVYSVTLDYFGLPTAELATRVAERELRARSVGLRRFTIKMDRRGERLAPGDVFKLTDVPRGISEMVLRVAEYDDGSMNDPTITVKAIQDVYAFPLTSFTQPQPGAGVRPPTEPELARRIVYEVPYVWLRRELPAYLFDALGPDSGYLGAGAEQPTGLSMGYQLWNKREGEPEYSDRGRGSFIPLGEVEGTVQYLDTTIRIKNIQFSDRMEALDSLLINEELLEVLSVEFDEVDELDQPVDGSMATLEVRRGVSDTRPWVHTQNDVIWFFDDGIGSDIHEYTAGESVDVKIRPWTLTGGAYPEELTPVDTVLFDSRFIRPYLPGRVRVNGEPWFVTGTVVEEDAPMVVTWTHRDRVAQDDQLVGHSESSIGPEPGSTYNVIVRDEVGDVIRNETGISGTSWTYDIETALADFGETEVNTNVDRTGYLTLQTQREVNGTVYDSWQNYEFSAQFKAYKFFMYVAQLARAIGVSDPQPSLDGVYVAHLARAIGMSDTLPNPEGVYVAQLQRAIGQRTAFAKTPDRLVMERPYIDQRRAGVSTTGRHVMAVAAQPFDKLPDYYDMLTARNPEPMTPDGFPAPPTDLSLYQTDDSQVSWARWGVAVNEMVYSTSWIDVPVNSSRVGLGLSALPAGALLAVDSEIMSVVSSTETQIRVKRGVADTVPSRHRPGARVWLLQGAQAGRVGYSRLHPADIVVAVKLLKQGFAGAVGLGEIGTVQVEIRQRVDRPYPPGRVLVNGDPWYNGGRIAEETDEITVTWEDRNRVTQGVQAVGHNDAEYPREAGAIYWLRLFVRPPGADEPVLLREETTAQKTWVLGYAEAREIGFQAARLLQQCGSASVTLSLYSLREGLESWQGYSIPLRLPAPECLGNNNPPTPLPNFPDDNNPPAPIPPVPPAPPGPGDDFPQPPEPPPEPQPPGNWPPPPPKFENDPVPVDPNDPQPPGEEGQGSRWSRAWGGSWGSDSTETED